MKCPNCQTDILTDQKFCNKCGLDLSAQQTSPEPIPSPVPSRSTQDHTNILENIIKFSRNNLFSLLAILAICIVVYFIKPVLGPLTLILGVSVLAVMFLQDGKTGIENKWNKACMSALHLDRLAADSENSVLENDRYRTAELIISIGNLAAIFTLPIIQLSQILRGAPLPSGLTSSLQPFVQDLFQAGGMTLPKLASSLGNLASILTTAAAFEYSKRADASNIILTLNFTRLIIYLVIFCSIAAIGSLFLKKNYSKLILLISGLIPLIIYAILYFSLSKLFSTIPFVNPSLLNSLLGLAFYCGVIASALLTGIAILRISQSKRNLQN